MFLFQRNPHRAHPLMNPRRLRYSLRKPVHPFCCRRRQEKQGMKGKGKKGIHKVTSGLYFNYLGIRPIWTDFGKNWHGCRGRWHNHSIQFWFQYFYGSHIYRGSNFCFPIDFAGHSFTTVLSLNTAQRVMTSTYLIDSAPNLGVYYFFVVDSVCLSVCHAAPSNRFFFFCFSM